MNDEFKKNWRERWLSSVNELTSIGLQQVSWTNISLNNPHWSFIEFLSCYFDDLVLSENYVQEIEQDFVSQNEYEVIEAWHKSLDNYKSPNNDDYDNYSILTDPNWIKIVELGKKSKLKLSEVLSLDEKVILTANINVV